MGSIKGLVGVIWDNEKEHRNYCLGFRVSGWGFRVEGLGLRLEGWGFRAESLLGCC